MDRIILEQMLEELTPKQKKVLKRILLGQNTSEIAKEDYVHPSAVSKLLSSTCKKFDEILKTLDDSRMLSNQPGEFFDLKQGLIDLFSEHMPDMVNPDLVSADRFLVLEVPKGVVPIESKFYIERPPMEEKCKEYIVSQGGLIRIKAPRQMGKSSLMNRTLAYAAESGFQTVACTLSELEQDVLGNLDLLLRCLCIEVTRQLKLENTLQNFWNKELYSTNYKCSSYFEEYILQQVDHGLVIGLDDVDKIFPFSRISADFLGLLRTWHERSKGNTPWRKVRFVIAHSTEDYPQIDVNQSPFNVGIAVSPEEFTREQIEKLADRYNLTGKQSRIGKEVQSSFLDELWQLVGGHPFLVRLAMFYGAREPERVETLLKSADTDAGIYGEHLLRLWEILSKDKTLADAMLAVLNTREPIALNPGLKFKLYSLGLIRYEGNKVVVRCALYQNYFQSVL
jgi:AAA-like domain